MPKHPFGSTLHSGHGRQVLVRWLGPPCLPQPCGMGRALRAPAAPQHPLPLSTTRPASQGTSWVPTDPIKLPRRCPRT